MVKFLDGVSIPKPGKLKVQPDLEQAITRGHSRDPFRTLMMNAQ